MRLFPLALLGVGCAGPSGFAVFEAEVVPVLEQSCTSSTCHGAQAGADEHIAPEAMVFEIDDSHRIVDVEAAWAAAKTAINTREDPAFSSMLRKPLATAWGGHPHHGLTNFQTPDDQGYQTIRAWIELESEGGEDPVPLDGAEQRFADVVQPILLSLTCATGNCHGPSAGVPFRLSPGLAGQVSIEGTRKNYATVVGMLSFDGVPEQSRLLRKSLPLHAGGILHKGGNTSFLGAADPRLSVLTDWVCEETLERTGRTCAAPSARLGVVFVRGPVGSGHAFDVDRFVPGTDLHLAWLDGGAPTNLTASLHTGAADVRDPAVDPSGERLAFAMRLAEDVGHELWELDLASGEATQLTHDAVPMPGGALRTYRDPAYGPDGVLYFVSTDAGVMADSGRFVDTDLYELAADREQLRRRTWTPHAERKPTFFTTGQDGDEIAFSALRETIPGQARAHIFRFPPGLRTEYHQHFGITPVEDLFFDMRELPDGRYVTVVGDLTGVWDGGRLGIVDRNFGPEIGETAGWSSPGLPFYADPLTRLDPDATAAGTTGGLYRDPSVLPDGRILVAYAPGPLDLDDEAADPQLGIHLITLEEAPDGSGPRIAERVVVIDEPGVAEFDPEPVVAHHLPSLTEAWAWDPEATTGIIHHQGLPLVDAILTNLPPSGPKLPDRAFEGVRLLEVVPVTPDDRQPIPPEEVRDGRTGASTVSLGSHGPARVLAELDLAADGTFQLELPAGIAVRIQGLGADGMALGTPHNRWFGINPGQVIRQGVQEAHYGTLCAACHGGIDGSADEAFREPDLLTTASLTLSRYAAQNPRQPIAPPLAGPATRSEVDFRRDVAPILEAHCSDCHGGATPAAGLSLTSEPTRWFSDAYESLLARGSGSASGMAYVDEPNAMARGSFLVELLTGVELDAPRALGTPGVPHPEGDPLSAAELYTLTRWIDLGATWVGREAE